MVRHILAARPRTPRKMLASEVRKRRDLALVFVYHLVFAFRHCVDFGFLPSACESSKIVCDQDLLRLTGSILVGAVVSITIGRAFLDLVLALGRFDECSD